MKAVTRSVLDPKTSGRPMRAAAGTAAAVGVLTAVAVVLSGSWPAAIVAGLAAATAVFLPYRYLITAQIDSTQEMRELWGLSGLLSDGRIWPAPGGWALRAGAMAALLQEMRLRKLQTVVELGPGASSIILSRAEPNLRMFGIEHDPDFLGRLNDQLVLHEIEGYQPILAPLEEQAFDGRKVVWYQPDSLSKLPEEIDVLIVDGPPNGAGRGNRSPAWSEMRSRLKPGSLVLVDDTDRPDERSMVTRWTNERLRVIHDGGEFILLEVT